MSSSLLSSPSEKVKVSTVERSINIQTGLFINNEFVVGHGDPIISINPSDQSVLATVHSVRALFLD